MCLEWNIITVIHNSFIALTMTQGFKDSKKKNVIKGHFVNYNFLIVTFMNYGF